MRLVSGTILALACFACGTAATPSADVDAGRAGYDASERDPWDPVPVPPAPPPCEDYGPLREATLPTLGPACAPCPESAPASRSPCTMPGLQCEYGDRVEDLCNARYECDGIGRWQLQWGGWHGICDLPVHQGGPCPTTLAEVRVECIPPGIACGWPEALCSREGCLFAGGRGAACPMASTRAGCGCIDLPTCQFHHSHKAPGCEEGWSCEGGRIAVRTECVPD